MRRGRIRFKSSEALLILAPLIVAGCAALGAGALSASGISASLRPTIAPAPAAAFSIPRPRPLQNSADLTWWAPVLRSTLARRAPSYNAAPRSLVPKLTPEGTSNLVVVIDRGQSKDSEQWVRVRLSTLPANQTGWVPRQTLGAYEAVDTRLIVNRERRTAILLRAGRPIFSARVGVGGPTTPTPAGQFYIRDELTRFHSSFYGPIAFGTSARSARLTDWPDGGYIGLHGTNQPQLIPGDISHGCVRFTDAAIRQLARLLPIGTPLTIE